MTCGPSCLRARIVRGSVVALVALPAAGVAGDAAGRPAPGVRAKQAEAKQVLAEVDALDARMERVVQAWDGARLELASVRARLAANRVALRRARAVELKTSRRLAQMLVRVYEHGQPSVVDVVLGAESLSDVFDELAFADRVAKQDGAVAAAASSAARRSERSRLELVRSEARQRTVVARLARSRAAIVSGIARRQSLLASIRTEIAKLQAEERAREEKLAAEARARIAREQQRLAAERARAARSARAESAQPQAPAAQPGETPPATTAGIDPSVTTTTSPSSAAPVPHPEAAAVAARYLGVPYAWGGESPAGFDCSGLVSYVYAQLGIALPHYTVAQWNATTPVAASDLQPGDLVFFDGLSHVGISIGGGQFIHAPHTGDVVRVSSMSGSYAGRFDGARRV